VKERGYPRVVSEPRREADRLLLWHTLFPLVRAIGLFLIPTEVDGLARLPKGGFILVANHASWIDPPWIEFVVNRPIRYMAKRELFEVPVLGWLLRQIGCFPVVREGADRRAVVHAMRVLDAGHVLGLFPEGHRSPTGALIRAHPGVGFIARRSAAVIVPVGVVSSRAARLGRFWRRDLTIRFGEPFRASELDVDRDEQRLADEIMRRIAALLPPEQHGVYSEGVS
jgi:1-acyl-sn-glycerol-3-phosphate acyltransferase